MINECFLDFFVCQQNIIDLTVWISEKYKYLAHFTKEQGLLFVVVLRLLTAVASRVAEHEGSRHTLGFSSCGLWV